MNRLVAMKNYGFDWYTTHGLTEHSAAVKLRAQGVDWVVVQNLLDPLPTSDVAQAPPPPTYSDRRFRDELHGQGLRAFEATAMFFQPQHLDRRPDLRPIRADGEPMERFGWYIGLCPTDPVYLSERAALIEQVASDLEPDGIFLSFIRFPGFWEMWMPETRRSEIEEYCFCDRCLERFSTETGTSLPDVPHPTLAALLQGELRAAWTGWKCAVIAQVVASMRAAADRGRPGIEVLINTIGFGQSDYGDARREVLGQDLPALTGPADAFELMVYHQISRRDPVAWIEAITAEARAETAATLLACLQTKPTYLDPPYSAGRLPTIPEAEHEEALRAVTRSAADGAMVYLWSDYLEDEATGSGHLTKALRRFKDGSL